MSNRTAAQRWADELAAWAVPQHILAAAPRRPFVFSPEMFPASAPGTAPRSRATEIAADAVPAGGTILDVGSGGGAAAFALVPPAGRLVATDRQEDMLAVFAATAAERGVPATTVLGSWPEVAPNVPSADVVVCHNVLYNVADLAAFAAALTAHAHRRVVVEITARHPQVARAPLWQRFWGLERPTGPDAALAAEVLHEAGIDVIVETSTATERDRGRAAPVEAAFWCRQLCLPPEREPEVAVVLQALPFPPERVTLWWDADPARTSASQ
jgi:precorrin-6B methylase 2